MSYLLEELRPANPILSIGDRVFTISLITLRLDSIIKKLIGPINSINETLTKNPLLIFDLTWILIIEKSEFKNKKEFTNFIYSQAKTSEVSLSIKNAIDEALYLSAPKIKNKANYDALVKINQAAQDSVVCYGVYYDRIAKRYGYTIDQFYDLTLGQVNILLNVSSDENFKDIEISAALQGKKLKQAMKVNDLDESQDKKLDDEAKDLLERMKKDYKNGK